MRTYIKNFFKYRGLLISLVNRDITVKYKRSIIGVFWSILNPIFIMLIITVVFSTIFRFDIANFPLYMLSGQILFNFMAESTTLAMTSIQQNSSLIKKVYVPKYIFPVSKVVFSFVNLLFALMAVFVFLAFSGIKISPVILLVPLSLLYVFLFSLGLGLILATYGVFFRDVIHLYGVVIVGWTYLTPLFYPIRIIPQKYLILIEMNPMYYFIEHFRDVLLYAKVPSLSLNLLCLSMGVGSLFIGLYVFYKNQDKFIYYL